MAACCCFRTGSGTIFTVVNKCDRYGEDPLKLVSDVEAELGIIAVAAHWPIHMSDPVHGTMFKGVYDRRRTRAYLFERDEKHGADKVATVVLELSGPDDQMLVEALGSTDEAVDAVARLKARGMIVNAVDRPALCDFTTPAIIERDPVLVAIGTGFFMLSDALLATHRFVSPLPMSQVWVLGTYYAAQVLIVMGVLRGRAQVREVGANRAPKERHGHHAPASSASP